MHLFLLLLLPLTAHAIEPSEVEKAIAKTKQVGIHRTVPVPLKEGGVLVLDVWEFRPEGCGKDVGVNATVPKDVSAPIGLIAFTPTIVEGKTIVVAFIDADGNGVVDGVANTTMTPLATQPMYDAIVRCIARK